MIKRIFTKQKLIKLAFTLLVILAAEYTLEILGFPAWPAMMCMVLFFVNHQDTKSAVPILAGGAFGILNAFIIEQWHKLVVPLLGGDIHDYAADALFQSKIIYVLIFVSCIILMKDVAGSVFNSYAFMFFLVAALALNGHLSTMPATNIFMWLGVELIGGGFIVLMLVGAEKLSGMIMANGVRGKKTSMAAAQEPKSLNR
ncbi:hypothetical protein [Hominibacterium faecale]|uniref:hypothetical protein n=1 Tax=Hominibacterium faecale TaxID=2839743 RepID=UPI0022B2A446|nr:hypothetical protein [Hominibacterium faecale]